MPGFSSHSPPHMACESCLGTHALPLCCLCRVQLHTAGHAYASMGFSRLLPKHQHCENGLYQKANSCCFKGWGNSSKWPMLVLVYSNLCSRVVLFPVQSKDPIASFLHRKAHETTPQHSVEFLILQPYKALCCSL